MNGAQEPGTVARPASATERLRRSPRLRLIGVVVAGIVALLCLGGTGVALVLYDNATKIDRGTPDGAVDNYLRAYLVERDDTRAALFACQGSGAPPALAALRSDVENRERSFSMTVSFSWGRLDVIPHGDRATVTTRLQRAVSDGSERIADPWSFDVVDQDGWRVCGATRLA